MSTTSVARDTLVAGLTAATFDLEYHAGQLEGVAEGLRLYMSQPPNGNRSAWFMGDLADFVDALASAARQHARPRPCPPASAAADCKEVRRMTDRNAGIEEGAIALDGLTNDELAALKRRASAAGLGLNAFILKLIRTRLRKERRHDGARRRPRGTK